jgi:O-antigen/teichoic acid export membrane protein
MTSQPQAQPTAAAPPGTSEDEARVAGRGFLLITFAKLWFMVTGAVISLGLPRLLGDPALYGDYDVVNRFITILNMVMIAGTIQAVSKAVSERDGVARSVQRTALLAQLFVGAPIAILVFVLADLVAAELFNDPALAIYFRIASMITLFYSFYAVFVGLCNGTKRFFTQAALDVTFSTMKMTAIVTLVVLGLGVTGAFAGFAGAALAVTAVAAFATRAVVRAHGDSAAAVPLRRVLLFMLPVMLYTFLQNGLLQADSLLLKALKYEPMVAHFTAPFGGLRMALLTAPLGVPLPTDAGLDPVIAAFAQHGTSTLTGVYGAAKNLATLPYQAIIAITFVVFPMISRATFDADRDRTRTYIGQTFRYTLILLALAVVALVAASEEVIRVLFGPAYLFGDPALALLLVAIVGFALFHVGNAIVTSAGRPGVAAAITGITIVLNLGLLWLFLGWSGLATSALTAAAAATLVSMFVGFALTGGWLLLRFRALAPPATIVRVLLIGAAVAWGARLLPLHGFVGLVAKAALAAAAFVVGLLVTREFGAADLARLRRVFARGARPPAAKES